MLSEICDQFRRVEKDTTYGCVILLDDVRLQSLVVAWSFMKEPEVRASLADSKILHESKYHEDAVVWEAMWRSVRIDQEELSRRAGLDGPESVTPLLWRLITSRVIYPDGTVHEAAMEILAARAVKTAEAITGREGAE